MCNTEDFKDEEIVFDPTRKFTWTNNMFLQQFEWEHDTLHVKDIIREISDNLDKQFEEVVVNHFQYDMSDLREYMKDRIAWRKKYEPRVMTLEDLHLDSNEPSVVCWIEFRDKSAVNVTAPYNGISYVCIPFLGTDFKMFCHRDAYGVSWRCWTNEPTYEQRQSIGWKGECDGKEE